MASGEKEVRFEFGKNWTEYSATISDVSVEQSKNNLIDLIREQNLAGKTFLDIGSGSGLHSLAARLLGAEVTSFDYDTYSVECTRGLRKKKLVPTLLI